MANMTKEEATEFFSEFYYGEHHIPKHQVFEFGHGWMVKHETSSRVPTGKHKMGSDSRERPANTGRS